LGAAVPVIGPILAILAASGVFKNEKGFKFDNAADAGGRNRTQLIESPFGNYDFAGDFDNKMVQPFIDAVAKIDKQIVDTFLPTEAALADARARVQAIKDGRWFGSNSKEETEASMKAATLRFLKERYGAVFSTIDQGIAASISSFSGSTDELLEYVAKVVQLADAFDAIIEEVPQLELSLGEFINASEESRNTLATLAATLKLSSLDFVAAADEAIANASRTPSEVLAAQSAKVLDLARAFDGSLAQAQALAQAESERLQIVQGLLIQIGQISAEISGMFAASAENFRLATMDDSQKYAYFDEQAAGVFAELQAATDPQRIRELAGEYNRLLSASFGLLDEQQQKDTGEQFATLAENANELVQARLAAAREAAIADAKATSTEIKIAILEAMSKVTADMQESANVLRDAANRMDETSRRPIVVTGYIETPDGNRTPLDVQAGAQG
jgi:hypothetical protein